MSDYRLEGHEGIYWLYPNDTPTSYGSRLVGAVGIVSHGYWGWTAQPVRRNCRVKGWGWTAPTRKQALDQLFAWLGASVGGL